MEANFAFESGSFSVESEKDRTVKFLAVPYGEVGKFQGVKFTFRKGSISHPEPLSKVKLLRGHNPNQSVGYATAIEETDRGLYVTFQVAEGPEGDLALKGITDKTYDGASVSVDYEFEDLATDKGMPDVAVISKSRLREVSQVSIPAFESAGLAASRKGDHMSEDSNGAVNNAAPLQFSNEQFKDLLNAIKPQKVEDAPVQGEDNVVPRADFSNQQEKPVAQVTEAGPYRFDGSAGRFEFSSDVIDMNRGNGEARARVLDFMRAEFAVTTTNAATLNPTIQRPDMYVDQLDYTTPIWNTIAKGTPPNGVNPFAFPKYSSSSGLVADHVEGTEPSLGAFAVTNQTVTPTALSGKIEVNREAWDMGGNPSLSNLIRNEMHRAYREGLETAAATFLDAQSFTTITLTTASADSALEGALITALVDLQGARGGYRLTDFLVHADLYKSLVLAKDSTGRRLFPALGPTNATGTVARNFSTLDINGLAARYAWALGATGTVAEKSYLLAPEDVHGWATAPQDMTFDIQVKSVYLGIWGYKAFAVSRTDGVRTFSYDPVA